MARGRAAARLLRALPALPVALRAVACAALGRGRRRAPRRARGRRAVRRPAGRRRGHAAVGAPRPRRPRCGARARPREVPQRQRRAPRDARHTDEAGARAGRGVQLGVRAAAACARAAGRCRVVSARAAPRDRDRSRARGDADADAARGERHCRPWRCCEAGESEAGEVAAAAATRGSPARRQRLRRRRGCEGGGRQA